MSECALCKQPIDPDDKTVWKLVSGWVGGPRKDSMKLRTDMGELAHDQCVRDAAAGQDPATSTDLFHEPENAKAEPVDLGWLDDNSG